jgi:thiol-disulfide isomerase/thioredoxin
LLIRDVAKEFGDTVKVVTEEYGNSPMATKYGVRRYPVVFVDDVIVARPKDFGFAGKEDVGSGRYVPWGEAANQQRFKTDLRGFITIRLKGGQVSGFDPSEVGTAADADGPDAVPAMALSDLAGRPIAPDDLKNRVVLVELWATWCPPCRSTLAWLNQVQQKYRDRVAVVAIAVDSKEDEVREMMADLKPAYRVAMGTPKVLEQFGTVAAVPKLFIYDKAGARAEVLFGAPPDLHERVGAVIERLVR